MDAFQLRTVTDIDTHWAHLYALLAINAVASAVPTLTFAMWATRFAAIIAIGNVQSILIRQSALNTRPRAHICADLLAHPSCQEVGRECKDAREEVRRKRRLASEPAFGDSWRIMPVKNECATGPEGND